MSAAITYQIYSSFTMTLIDRVCPSDFNNDYTADYNTTKTDTEATSEEGSKFLNTYMLLQRLT